MDSKLPTSAYKMPLNLKTISDRCQAKCLITIKNSCIVDQFAHHEVAVQCASFLNRQSIDIIDKLMRNNSCSIA